MSGPSARVVRRQRLLLRIAFFAGRCFARVGRRVSWIIGAEEIAGMVSHIGRALPDSLTMVLRPHEFYAHKYDVTIQRPDARFEVWRRLYLGSIMLGWWLARAQGVVYVGGAGYLSSDDEREFEFAFVRTRRRAIVCCFTGTDIRSPQLMAAEAHRTGLANIGSIQRLQGAPFDEPAYEQTRKDRAAVADRHANAIFSARVDQLSYLTSHTEPFLYFYPDDHFVVETKKFEDLSRIVVLHAPSNPTLKGTQTVRAVMARIVERFPHVEYRELSSVPNEQVLMELDSTHIVLNQFHAQMPGVFGIEAMARFCVMVCSADPDVETDLVGAAGAWVVAGPDELEERLADLVESPERLEPLARAGNRWAQENASQSASAIRIRAILARAAAESRR